MVVTVNGNTQTLEGNGAGIINQAITAIGEGAISLGINSSGNCGKGNQGE